MAVPFGGASGGSDIIRTRSEDLIVSGWTFPWDSSSWHSLQDWTTELDEVSPYWYYALGNGTVVDSHERTEDRDLIVHCRNSNMKMIPMVSNNHDVDVISRIITNSTVMSRHIQELLNISIMNGWEGVDINYENIPSALKDEYSEFIRQLSGAFHQRNKMVYVSVFPKVADDEDREGPGAYDYRAIGQYADSVRVMAYNLHWSSAEMSGPITSYDWVKQVMEYSADAIQPSKISLGIPLFGYDWEVDRNGRALNIADNRSFSNISKLLEEPGIDRQWNGSSRTPFLKYTEPSGKLHAIHYNDAESLLHELLILRDLGLNRISLWRIGGEDPLVRDYIGRVKASGLSDLPPYVDIGGDTQGMKGTELEIGPVRAYDLDGRLSDIKWDFGDGETSELIDPVHVFQRGGSYSPLFRVIDEGGNTVTRTKTVLVGPYPYFEISAHPEVDTPFSLDATGSWDLGRIISYNWDMGDGTYLFHAGPKVDHTFHSPGHYNITLTVMNDRGYTDTMSILATVEDRMEPFVTAGGDMIVWEDMDILFDGRGSYDDSGSIELEWTFHDNSTIKGPVATYHYSEPGLYRVTLRGTDPSNKTSMDEITVEVRDRTAPCLEVRYPNEIELGDTIRMDAGDSSDNVGIEEINWRLPEGETRSDEYTIDYHPTSAGRYFFTLDLIDSRKNWNSTTFFVDVLDLVPPDVEFYIDPAPANWNDIYLSKVEDTQSWDLQDADVIFVVNVTYRFLVTMAEDDSGIAYTNWSFGDGTKAHGGSVYHNFSQAGLYPMSLDVDDMYGNRFHHDMMILVVPTVNFTLNPIQPYQDVYVEQPLEDREEERRILPITLGISTVLLLILMVLGLLVYEGFVSIGHINRRYRGGDMK